MTTDWAVDAAAEQFTLDARQMGELTFTVANPGPVDDIAVFDVVPGDGAERSWFTVDDPQRRVPGRNGFVSYLVRVSVPPGTRPGRYEVVGRASSANTAPEESARLSGRVTLDVKAVEKKKFPWLPVVVGAVVLLIVIGVVGYLVAKPGKPKVTPSAAAVVELEAEALAAQDDTTVSSNAGAVVVNQDDCCGVKWSGGKQMFFQGHAPGDTVAVTFTIAVTGDYTFSTIRTTAPDYANTRFTIDSVAVGGVFFGFTQGVAVTDWITVGTVHLTAGPHRLTLSIVGKNQATNHFYAGLDKIRFAQTVAP